MKSSGEPTVGSKPTYSPFRVFLNRCLCYPCWAAKCACGTWLTKHAFTEDDARVEAEDALTRTDRWGHSCEKSAQQQLEMFSGV